MRGAGAVPEEAAMTVGRMWRGILAGVLGMALLQGVTAAPADAVPVAGSLSLSLIHI